MQQWYYAAMVLCLTLDPRTKVTGVSTVIDRKVPLQTVSSPPKTFKDQ